MIWGLSEHTCFSQCFLFADSSGRKHSGRVPGEPHSPWLWAPRVQDHRSHRVLLQGERHGRHHQCVLRLIGRHRHKCLQRPQGHVVQWLRDGPAGHLAVHHDPGSRYHDSLRWQLPHLHPARTHLRQQGQQKHPQGLVQDCGNSSALTMELLQSCTKPSIYDNKTSVVMMSTLSSLVASGIVVMTTTGATSNANLASWRL